MALGRKTRKYAHNKPTRSRRKTVHVKSYCRRKGLGGWIQRELARKDMPF